MSTTVVTCYYNFASKHSHQKYDEWITNFLTNVSCQLVIFTSPDLVEYLENKRLNFLEKTKIIPINLSNLKLYNLYIDLWDYQYMLDKQKDTGRTKECYILWNSKIWFLKEAIRLNPFLSDKFIWTDIGCLRTNDSLTQFISNNYPIYDKISDSQIDIVLLEPINTEQKVFIDEVHFSGAMFGGHKDNILLLYDLFYTRLDEHIKQNIFVGCDQQTITSIYNDNRALFNCISPKQIPFDNWFYLWIYYSDI
jgi:hypothetical protein